MESALCCGSVCEARIPRPDRQRQTCQSEIADQAYAPPLPQFCSGRSDVLRKRRGANFSRCVVLREGGNRKKLRTPILPRLLIPECPRKSDALRQLLPKSRSAQAQMPTQRFGGRPLPDWLCPLV